MCKRNSLLQSRVGLLSSQGNFFALMSVIFTSVVNLLQVFTQIILTFIIKNSNVLIK
jgi:hypothetical protein